MAHFAKLDENNIVTNVIHVSNNDTSDFGGVEMESIGIAWCHKNYGSTSVWKQTSYNGRIRGHFAGVGMTYMSDVQTLGVASTDIFIEQQPHPSWTVGIQTAQWYSPNGEMPQITEAEGIAGKYYIWDESAYQADNTQGWTLTVSSDHAETTGAQELG